MDKRIKYHRAKIAAIRRHRVRAFVLTSGNLTAAQQAQRFLDNAGPILAACAALGPFVYSVQQRRILRIFP